jgi:O-antigen/teichoic acid export membrane protein
VLLVSLISIPITVRYLGAELYGIWITISTTIAMLVYLDVGIATTLTNLISESFAQDDPESAGHYFSTAFWMSVSLSIGFATAGWLLWPHIDFGYLLGIRDPALIPSVSRAVMVAAFLFLLGLPAGLATRALAGYQELHVANLFSAGGNILALFSIVLVVALRGSLVMLVAAYAGAIVLGSAVCLLWVCFIHKPWLRPSPEKVRLHLLRNVLSTGGQFFLIQIAGLVVFNSDNLVISHFLSPSEVTPYSVTWRLVTYANAIQILSNQALWPAYAEAWARGDIAWMRSAYARLRWMTIGALIVACAVLIPFGRWIILIWAGRLSVPNMPLLLLMCVWMAIYAITANQACLVGATSRVGKLSISAVVAAAANLVLSMHWVRTMGTFGVLLGTVASYIIFILVVQAIEVRSILRTKTRAAVGP